MAISLRPASLKVRALQWLAQREHSPHELRAKLLRAAAGRRVVGGAHFGADVRVDVGLDAGTSESNAEAGASAVDDDPRANKAADTAAAVIEVDALLDWLGSHGHLSAQRFVESRIHSRQSRFGNQRIRQELRQHGLQPDAAAQAALRDTELARASEVWQRKYGAPASDAAGRVRQMRFLAGRGFSAEVVRQVVRGSVRNPVRGDEQGDVRGHATGHDIDTE